MGRLDWAYLDFYRGPDRGFFARHGVLVVFQKIFQEKEDRSVRSDSVCLFREEVIGWITSSCFIVRFVGVCF